MVLVHLYKLLPLYRPQAPEVLRRDYGPAADVWSLGVCLYTLLSGLLPFLGETEEEVFDMVLHAGGLLRMAVQLGLVWLQFNRVAVAWGDGEEGLFDMVLHAGGRLLAVGLGLWSLGASRTRGCFG